MKKIIISTLILFVFCIGCTERNEDQSIDHLKNQNMEKLEKEKIEKLLMNYQNILNTSDADGAAKLYTKDGAFMPTGAPTAIGTQNLKGAYEFVFSQIQLSIKFSIEEIVVENNFAYAMTGSQGTTLIHANGETVPEENRELFVFEKENGEWKIARYMFNKTS